MGAFQFGTVRINLYAAGQTNSYDLWQIIRMANKKPVRRTVASDVKSFEIWLDKYPETMSGFERESLAAEAMLAAEKRKSGKQKKGKPREAFGVDLKSR